MKTLVSGSSSGLGAWLAVMLRAERYERTFDSLGGVNRLGEQYDLIVHCAFAMPDYRDSFDNYLKSQLSLCRSLLKIPHRRFAFISSLDVLSDEHPTFYSLAKLRVEEEVRTQSPGALILRPGALFGPGMRPNQILKVARGDKELLTLSSQSRFSVVMYEDLAAALKYAPLGTWHVTALRVISLLEIATQFNTNPNWGKHIYDTSNKPCDLPFSKDYPYILIDPIERLRVFLQNSGWLSIKCLST